LTPFFKYPFGILFHYPPLVHIIASLLWVIKFRC
jgi:hypothetical protein